MNSTGILKKRVWDLLNLHSELMCALFRREITQF